MSIKRSKETFGVNIGTSSLLLVFVIMCLVSFATLSTVSASADKKLNDKILQRTEQYYDACNQAEERLRDIDATLEAIYDSSANREEYLATTGEHIDFAIAVSDVQTLNVQIAVNYPNAYDNHFYNIEKWQLVTTGSLEEEEDTGLNLLF